MDVVPLCKSNTSWHTQDNHPHPVLSPDQREVLFTSDGDGGRRIYSVPAGCTKGLDLADGPDDAGRSYLPP